jgi:hypothetical protein
LDLPTTKNPNATTDQLLQPGTSELAKQEQHPIILPSFKENCDVANVASILPSLPCDPTIAQDPRRTPAKASLQEVSDLQICEQITSSQDIFFLSECS